MELPGRCGDWLDTDTVTVQGFKLRLGTTSKGWGFYSATSGGLSHGHGHQRYVTKPAACAALDTVPTAVTSADTGAEITRTSNPDQFDCANLPRDAARCASPMRPRLKYACGRQGMRCIEICGRGHERCGGLVLGRRGLGLADSDLGGVGGRTGMSVRSWSWCLQE